MDHWVIWSEEHGGWWQAGSQGYTYRLDQAGVYSEAAALAIEERANKYRPAGKYHEIAMPDPRAAWRRRVGID